MPIPEDLAYKLATQLTTIPECPRSEDEALAADLEELCRHRKEAEELVQKARHTLKRWTGTAGLIELLDSIRSVPPPSNQAINHGPMPIPDCAACQDWGHFSAAGAEHWCTCSAAETLRRSYPDWVDRANRKPDAVKLLRNPVPIDCKPITDADLKRAFAARQNRADKMIAEARATLCDPHASKDRKEIARELLRGFSVPEHEPS